MEISCWRCLACAPSTLHAISACLPVLSPFHALPATFSTLDFPPSSPSTALIQPRFSYLNLGFFPVSYGRVTIEMKRLLPLDLIAWKIDGDFRWPQVWRIILRVGQWWTKTQLFKRHGLWLCQAWPSNKSPVSCLLRHPITLFYVSYKPSQSSPGKVLIAISDFRLSP